MIRNFRLIVFLVLINDETNETEPLTDELIQHELYLLRFGVHLLYIQRAVEQANTQHVHTWRFRPDLQNFVKWTFAILSQFFHRPISFVCQL